MSKRILAMILALVTIVSIAAFSAIPASAATDNNTLNIRAGGKAYTAQVGDTVTVSVSFTYSKKISYGQVELPVNFTLFSGPTEAQINDSAVTYFPVVSDTAYGARFDTAAEGNLDLAGYVGNFASYTGYSFSDTKVVMQVPLTVLSGGNVSITPSVRNVEAVDGTTLVDENRAVKDNSFSYTVGVTVGSAGRKILVGDVDGNGTVNNTDAILLKRKVMNWTGMDDKIKVPEACDVNRNGTVDNTDAIILKRCVMNWSGQREKYIIEITV